MTPFFKANISSSPVGTIPLFGSKIVRAWKRENNKKIRQQHRIIVQQKIDKAATILSIDDGATMIADRAIFELLAHRDDVPGASGIREVKFIILKVQGKEPLLYFMNSKKYAYHYTFAEKFLDIPLTIQEFTAKSYFTKERAFLVGTVLAHDNFIHEDGQKGLYSLEFWPSDPVDAALVIKGFKLIDAAMPFAKGKLFYHPSGAIQEEKAQQEKTSLEEAKIPLIFNNKLFSNLRYSALNRGVGFGYLRIIDGANPQPLTTTTIALFKALPNNLPHVAGVISEQMQTPLSHVNLLAKQNNTPNAYLKNASIDPRLLALEGKIVRLAVLPDGLKVRLATQTEMITFLKQIRPKGVQFPQRDLSKQKIRPLAVLNYRDSKSVGAKAANLAELRFALGSKNVVCLPKGFAVPFYFYHHFMVQNNLYVYILNKISKKGFLEEAAFRKKTLKKIRKKVRHASMPKILHDQLGVMMAQFPKGTTPRCRSSTNNEDLPNFNGAGLYSSHTHRVHEGHIDHTIQQVWASLWNFRAFEERVFHRIDHFQSAMGVLVHPNFDDEQANGVAVTKNIYYPDYKGFYINAQIGENLVTNPEKNAIPEEIVVLEEVNDYNDRKFETILVRRSSLVAEGQRVLNQRQLDLLILLMARIQGHFLNLYRKEELKRLKSLQGSKSSMSIPKNLKLSKHPESLNFAMDIEFKIDKNGQLIIKQARPWLD